MRKWGARTSPEGTVYGVELRRGGHVLGFAKTSLSVTVTVGGKAAIPAPAAAPQANPSWRRERKEDDIACLREIPSQRAELCFCRKIVFPTHPQKVRSGRPPRIRVSDGSPRRGWPNSRGIQPRCGQTSAYLLWAKKNTYKTKKKNVQDVMCSEV